MSRYLWLVLSVASFFPGASTADSLGDLIGIGRIILEADRANRQKPRVVPQEPRSQKPRYQKPRSTTSKRPTLPASQLSKDDLRSLQIRLQQLGYDPGVPDGIWGRRTSGAIQAFQKDYGLPSNGAATPGLRDTVASVWRTRTGNTADTQIATAASTPSFDCRLATIASERLICDNPQLARLDREIAAAYADARGRTAQPNAILDQQKSWIKQRDACGGSFGCLQASMSDRLNELSRTGPQFQPTVSASNVDRGGILDGTPSRSAQPAFGGLELSRGPDQIWRAGDRILLSAQGRYSEPIDDDVQRDGIGTIFLAINLPNPVMFSGPNDPLTSAIALLPQSEIVDAAHIATGEVPEILDGMIRKQPSETPKLALARAVRMSIQDQFGRGGFSDEFAVRAFLQEAASRLGSAAESLAPELPLKIRFFCPTQLEDFNFETESFPLNASSIRHCNLNKIYAYPASITIPIDFDLGELPQDVRMNASEAKAFRESLIAEDRFGRPENLDIHLSVDVDLHKGSQTKSGGVDVFTMQAHRAGPFELTLRDDPSKVIYRFRDEDLPVPELSQSDQVAALVGAGTTEWHLNDEVSRLALAQISESQSFEDLTWETRFEGQNTGTLKALFSFTPEGPEISAGAILSKPPNFIEELSAQLVLPRDHFATLAASSGDAPFDVAVLVSERPLSSYTAGAPAPPDKVQYYWAELAVGLYDTAITQTPDGRNILLVFGNPLSASLWIPKGGRHETVTQTAPFATVAFQTSAESVDGTYSAQAVWDVTDLAYHVATTIGVEPEAFVQEALKNGGFLRDDAFARQDAGKKLAAEVRPSANGAMALGTVRLGAYDFQRQGYPIGSVSLDLRQDKQFSARYALTNSVILRLDPDAFMPMPPEAARDWQEANSHHPEYQARLKVALGGVTERSAGSRYYNVEGRLSEIELLALNADPYLRDPRAILYRSKVLTEKGDITATEQSVAQGPSTPPADASDVSASVGTDILGIRLLQSLEDAKEQIGKEIGEYTTFTMTRKGWIEDGDKREEVFPWSPYREAILLSSKDGSNNITLFHEPDTEIEGKVSALARARFFTPGSGPGAEALIELLSEKYGPVAVQLDGENAARILLWQSTIGKEPDKLITSRCEGLAAGMMRGHLTRVRDELNHRKKGGQSHMRFQPWYDEAGELVSTPHNTPPFLSFMFRSPMACQREFVIATIQMGTDGRVETLRTVLVRPNLPHEHSEILRKKIESTSVGDAGEKIKL